jgi:beta-phosphoglucomutase
MSLRAAVFDFDGVIVDSEPLHFRSLYDTLRARGVTITRDEYVGMYLAYHDRESIRIALEHHGRRPEPELLDELEARKAARFAELIPEIPVFPGARELVSSLAEQVPVGIASGARHEEIEAILEGRGLRDLFSTIVGAEDAPRTKPDPAPYLTAAAGLAAAAPGLQPTQCVAFEDSMPGIAAALGAGMRVVGVANSYPAGKLQAAHRVVESLVGLAADGLRDLFHD